MKSYFRKVCALISSVIGFSFVSSKSVVMSMYNVNKVIQGQNIAMSHSLSGRILQDLQIVNNIVNLASPLNADFHGTAVIGLLDDAISCIGRLNAENICIENIDYLLASCNIANYLLNFFPENTDNSNVNTIINELSQITCRIGTLMQFLSIQYLDKPVRNN